MVWARSSNGVRRRTRSSLDLYRWILDPSSNPTSHHVFVCCGAAAELTAVPTGVAYCERRGNGDVVVVVAVVAVVVVVVVVAAQLPLSITPNWNTIRVA